MMDGIEGAQKRLDRERRSMLEICRLIGAETEAVSILWPFVHRDILADRE
jgi:hypothetical protein